MFDWLYAKKMYVGTIVAAIGEAVSFFYVMIEDEAISFDEANAFVLLVLQALTLVGVAVGIYKPRNAPTS